MNKVKVFNWLWYHVVIWLIPVKGKKHQIIERYYWRMRAQCIFAKLFGGVKGVIAGDSNGGLMNTYRTMSKFDRIIVNWCHGGTTAHEWYEFFVSYHGHIIKVFMYSVRQVFSLGGNYVLRSMMGISREGLKWIRTWFPGSYNCTVPPFDDENLSELFKSAGIEEVRSDPKYFRSGVIAINDTIREFWGGQCIDLYKIFADENGNARPGVRRDAVHYSDIAIPYIQKVFDVVL